jgi:hypothetical protein
MPRKWRNINRIGWQFTCLKKGVKRHFITALVLVCSAGPSWCATLERLSFDDMAARSTMIVRGKVMDSWAAAGNLGIFTHYKIQIEETFKGSARGAVEVQVPGGTVNGMRQSFAGSPSLNKGDDFVFFLWTSKQGMTWITGLTQGLFALPADGTADPTARRAANPELMLDPATARPVKDVAMSMRLSELRSRIAAALAGKGSGQ